MRAFPLILSLELGLSAASFSYAEVESVLAHVFDASSASALPKLRARYKKLRALGIPTGITPKRGEKSRYTLAQLLQIILCIEMAEFGMDTQNVVYLATHHISNDKSSPLNFLTYSFILPFHSDPQIREDHAVLYFSPSLMSSRWDDEKDRFFYSVINIESVDIIMSDARTRMCLISLKNLSKRIHAAIRDIVPAIYKEVVSGLSREKQHGDDQKA